MSQVGSGNGFALNRRQAITWTNADPLQWHIYAALGGDKLTHFKRVSFERVLQIKVQVHFCEILVRWMPHYTFLGLSSLSCNNTTFHAWIIRSDVKPSSAVILLYYSGMTWSNNNNYIAKGIY